MRTIGGPRHHEIEVLPTTSSVNSFVQSNSADAQRDEVVLEMARLDPQPLPLLTDVQKEQLNHSIAEHYTTALAAPAQKKHVFTEAIRVLRRDAVIEHSPASLRAALGELTQPSLVEAKCKLGVIEKLLDRHSRIGLGVEKQTPMFRRSLSVNERMENMRVLNRVALTKHYRDAAHILREAFQCEALEATAVPTAMSVSRSDHELALNLLGKATMELHESGAKLLPAEMIKTKMGNLLRTELPQLASEVNAHIDTELQRRVTERRMPIVNDLRSAAKFGATAVISTGAAVGSGIGGAEIWPRLSPQSWNCTSYERAQTLPCSLQSPKTKDVALSVTTGFGALVTSITAVGASFRTVTSLCDAMSKAWTQRHQLPLELSALTPKNIE